MSFKRTVARKGHAVRICSISLLLTLRFEDVFTFGAGKRLINLLLKQHCGFSPLK